MVRHGYLTDLHVFLLALFQGEGAATGLVSCGYLGGLGFLDRAHDICYRREEPFICVASIQIEQYLSKLEIQRFRSSV